MESLIRDLAKLSEMSKSTLREITDFALEKAVYYTNSKVGYLAFLNSDESVLTMHSWSKTAMKICAIENMTYTYPVATTGLWGDAVRKRHFQIHNDYAGSDNKKGYPAGHVEIKRHANVPIFFENKIVALIGVGNKDVDYDELDITKLTLLIEGMWRHIQAQNSKTRLEELIKELEDKNRLLAKSNEELMHFAFVASHDLKAPLRAIHNLATWIDEDLRDGKDVSGHIKLLNQRIMRMDSLTTALLEYSRIGRMHIEKEEIDILEIIKEVESDLRISGVKFDLKILKNPHCHGARLRINKTRIYQVFSNLICNAIKHHHDPDNIQIEISCHCFIEANVIKCKFCVADNGPGIDPKFHEKIFQIFQTLKPRDEIEGTGIGLSLVKKIIEENGGNAPIGFFTTTLEDGKIIKANAALSMILEYDTMEEMYANPITLLYVNPSGREELINRVKRDGYVKEVHINLKTNKGRNIWISITAKLCKGLCKVEGKCLNHCPGRRCIEGSVVDITYKKSLELEIQRLRMQEIEALQEIQEAISKKIKDYRYV